MHRPDPRHALVVAALHDAVDVALPTTREVITLSPRALPHQRDQPHVPFRIRVNDVRVGHWAVTLYQCRDAESLFVLGGQFQITAAARGRGIGTAVLDHVLRTCSRLGLTGMRFEAFDLGQRPSGRTWWAQPGAEFAEPDGAKKLWTAFRRLHPTVGEGFVGVQNLIARRGITPWELAQTQGGLEVLGSANWVGWWPTP